ncbi:MAG: hypothetical protein K0R29_2133 [Pseudobdellovibrio sp.]|jgi:hypothetical protein|nr:hypothetical protein [Pseudobdellovibrio sp.]
MKKLNLFAFFLISSQIAFGATFECQTFLNLDVISAQIVKTEVKVKTPVDQTDVAVSYLTEKANNAFTLEVFLPLSEIRIYSEATITDAGQSITSSAWTREYMVDVACRKLN